MRKLVLASALAVVCFAGRAEAQRGYIDGNAPAQMYNGLCTAAQSAVSSAAAIQTGYNFIMSWITGEDIAKETTQNINWYAQIQHNLCAYRTYLNQYRQMFYTANSLTGSRDALDFMRRLGNASRTFLPMAQQMKDAIGSGASVVLNADEWNQRDLYADVANPNGSKEMQFWLDESERRRRVNANVKAVVEAGMNDAEQRILQLEEAANKLQNSQDISEVENAKGVIMTAGQNLDLHRAQIANVSLMLEAERDVQKQRKEQNWQQGAVDFYNDAVSRWGGGIPR